MTDITQAQMAENFLKQIGHAAPGGAANGAVQDDVKVQLTYLLEQLERDGLVDFDITGQIPADHERDILDILEVKLAGWFGIQVDAGQERVARRELRQKVNAPQTDDERVTDY